MWIKEGVKLLEESVGDGASVQRDLYYILSMRLTLNKGEILRTLDGCLSQTYDDALCIHEDGYLENRVRIDRESLIDGVFYAVQGMKVGGYRKVSIAPHLAYREKGIPGLVPENAKIIAEIKVLSEVD
jgi:FKBP-type peptidyl-prolyl cis-trans isomerase 2